MSMLDPVVLFELSDPISDDVTCKLCGCMCNEVWQEVLVSDRKGSLLVYITF